MRARSFAPSCIIRTPCSPSSVSFALFGSEAEKEKGLLAGRREESSSRVRDSPKDEPEKESDGRESEKGLGDREGQKVELRPFFFLDC